VTSTRCRCHPYKGHCYLGLHMCSGLLCAASASPVCVSIRVSPARAAAAGADGLRSALHSLGHVLTIVKALSMPYQMQDLQQDKQARLARQLIQTSGHMLLNIPAVVPCLHV
jgi:hypothetical protein